MRSTFTLILTKGMHIVSAEVAGQIKDALASNAATVDVLLDPFGGLTDTRMTTLALQHVVALTVNPIVDTMPANVSRIGPRPRG